MFGLLLPYFLAKGSRGYLKDQSKTNKRMPDLFLQLTYSVGQFVINNQAIESLLNARERTDNPGTHFLLLDIKYSP